MGAAAHQPQVRLHAGEQQQQQDADLRDRIDHALQRLVVGEDPGARFGKEQTEHRGPEQHARQQLAEQGGLADAAHQFAQQTAEQQQQDQLGREDRQRVVGCHRNFSLERSALPSPFKWGGVGVRAFSSFARKCVADRGVMTHDPSVADDRATSPFEWGGFLP